MNSDYEPTDVPSAIWMKLYKEKLEAIRKERSSVASISIEEIDGKTYLVTTLSSSEEDRPAA